MDPLRAMWITASGGVDTAVMLPTEPVLAVLGLIAYVSSTTLTAVERLTVVELTPHLSMWTSTNHDGCPSLCATRVAAAFGHCEMVHGTAVFTGPVAAHEDHSWARLTSGGAAMALKLIEAAQDCWRAVNAPHLVALVRTGAVFVNGQTPRTTRRPPPNGSRLKDLPHRY